MVEIRKGNRGPIRLGLRLQTALELGGRGETAADIGCDHGLLSCTLLEQGYYSKVIAADISEPSLEKCRSLADLRGIQGRIDFRVGDGLSCLQEGEADTVFLLGMGGTLIARILEAAKIPLAGAKRAVLSPMAGPGIADLREYLYLKGYPVFEDRLVREEGRLYQLLAVGRPVNGGRDILPAGWPEACFELGYRAYLDRAPLFHEALAERIQAHSRRLQKAVGTAGEAALQERLNRLLQIQQMMEEVHEAE